MLKTSLLLLTMATVSLSTTPSNTTAVEFTTDNSLYISENIKQICAITADNMKDIQYSIIGGKDKNQFNIDQKTGKLSFIHTPNYESPLDSDLNNKYEVIVAINRDMEIVNRKQFTITVLDMIEL